MPIQDDTLIDRRLSFISGLTPMLPSLPPLHRCTTTLSLPPSSGFSSVLRRDSNGYFMFPRNYLAVSGAQLAMRTLPYQPCCYLQWDGFTHPAFGLRVQGNECGGGGIIGKTEGAESLRYKYAYHTYKLSYRGK